MWKGEKYERRIKRGRKERERGDKRGKEGEKCERKGSSRVGRGRNVSEGEGVDMCG